MLREAESGDTIVEVCRKHGISQQTFYLWKQQSLAAQCVFESMVGRAGESRRELFSDCWLALASVQRHASVSAA